jgi:hypothetical protein
MRLTARQPPAMEIEMPQYTVKFVSDEEDTVLSFIEAPSPVLAIAYATNELVILQNEVVSTAESIEVYELTKRL